MQEEERKTVIELMEHQGFDVLKKDGAMIDIQIVAFPSLYFITFDLSSFESIKNDLDGLIKEDDFIEIRKPLQSLKEEISHFENLLA